MDLLFVYGTLRADAAPATHRLLADNAELVSGAQVRGELYDLGTYPGLVARTDADTSVRGEVYRLHAATAVRTLQTLDHYEGCAADDPEPHEYRRDRVSVELDSGAATEAWAYLLQRDTSGLPLIPSGDYVAHHPAAGRSRVIAERPPKPYGAK